MAKNKRSTARTLLAEDDLPRDLTTPAWRKKFDAALVKRGRPKAAKPKVSTTVRLDADVLAHFRRRGPGWQTRLNATLRKALGMHHDT